MTWLVLEQVPSKVENAYFFLAIRRHSQEQSEEHKAHPHHEFVSSPSCGGRGSRVPEGLAPNLSESEVRELSRKKGAFSTFVTQNRNEIVTFHAFLCVRKARRWILSRIYSDTLEPSHLHAQMRSCSLRTEILDFPAVGTRGSRYHAVHSISISTRPKFRPVPLWRTKRRKKTIKRTKELPVSDIVPLSFST